MAKQSLVWTVLPNGFTEDKKSLRVSLLLSPHLEPQGEPEILGTFPDFFADGADWTPHWPRQNLSCISAVHQFRS
jgi:hypothetical protein